MKIWDFEGSESVIFLNDCTFTFSVFTVTVEVDVDLQFK